MEIFVFECDLFIIGLYLGSHKMNEKKKDKHGRLDSARSVRRFTRINRKMMMN